MSYSDVILFIEKVFLDKTVKLKKRLSNLLIAIFIIGFINNSFDFTHTYRISKKAEILIMISQILKDSTLENENKNLILYERSRLITRQTIIDKICIFSSNCWENSCEFIAYQYLDVTKSSSKIQNKKNVSAAQTHSIFLNFVSINFNLVILLLLIIIGIFVNQSEKSIASKLISIFLVILLFSFLIIIAHKLTFKIPMIFNSYWYNYGLNFLIQTIPSYYLYFRIKREMRKTNK